eukprot:2811049-Pleurochrysis_carterae.AAC.3
MHIRKSYTTRTRTRTHARARSRTEERAKTPSTRHTELGRVQRRALLQARCVGPSLLREESESAKEILLIACDGFARARARARPSLSLIHPSTLCLSAPVPVLMPVAAPAPTNVRVRVVQGQRARPLTEV